MKTILLGCVLVAALTLELDAQTLTGIVTDNAGVPVPNARITLFNNDTTQFWETRSDDEGVYWFTGLPDGGPYLFFGVAAPGMEYFQNATSGIIDTLEWNAVLEPEVHQGNWEIIMTSPEPLGGTDLGILLPDGNIYYCHNTKDPFLFSPSNNDTLSAPGHEQNQGCVAPALLNDGRVFFGGGTLQKIYGPGTNKVKIFDPASGSWAYQPDLLDYRWYPTLAPLYDGTLLIVGGGGLDNPKRVKTSEVYDPLTGESVAADTILLGNEVSPIVPLYNGDILMTHRPPQLFDPVTRQWELASDFVQGPRMPNGDHSDHELILYPDGRVLAVGYKSFVPGEPGTLLELYDAEQDKWSLRSSFSPSRSRAKAVLLPDQKVLVLGGQKEDPDDPTPVNNWGYMRLTDQYNVTTDAWRRLQNMNFAREYHTIATLIPDGRVVVVGGEGAPGNEPAQSIIEAFSPPYLFRGIRPEISNLNQSEFRRGEAFAFTASKTNAITGVVLMSHPVLTHFMNSGNNRYIELDFVQSGSDITAILPSDSLILMPGWYMLFAMVDDIPSIGEIVHVQKGEFTVSRYNPVNVDELSIVVFPNPAANTINVGTYGFATNELIKVKLISPLGALVSFMVVDPNRQTAFEMQLPSGTSPGVYLLQLSNGNRMIVQKIVLQ